MSPVLDFNTKKEAAKKGLVEFTHWLKNNEENRSCLKKFGDHIMRDSSRVILYVIDDRQKLICLYINDVCSRKRKNTKYE